MARVSYLRLRRTLLQGRAPWLAFLGLSAGGCKQRGGRVV